MRELGFVRRGSLALLGAPSLGSFGAPGLTSFGAPGLASTGFVSAESSRHWQSRWHPLVGSFCAGAWVRSLEPFATQQAIVINA